LASYERRVAQASATPAAAVTIVCVVVQPSNHGWQKFKILAEDFH